MTFCSFQYFLCDSVCGEPSRMYCVSLHLSQCSLYKYFMILPKHGVVLSQAQHSKAEQSINIELELTLIYVYNCLLRPLSAHTPHNTNDICTLTHSFLWERFDSSLNHSMVLSNWFR